MRKSLFKHLTDRGIQVGALVTNPSVPVYKCLPQNTASCTLSLFCSIPTTSIRAAEVKLCVSVCGWETLLLQKRCRHWHVLCARVGFQVYIWVLNEEEDFQRAFDLGATGIMTDFPSRLKDFMDRRGISKLEWREKMCRRPARPRCNVVFWSCVLSLLLRCSVHTLYSHPVFPVTKYNCFFYFWPGELFLVSVRRRYCFETVCSIPTFHFDVLVTCAEEDALINSYQKVYNHLIWFIIFIDHRDWRDLQWRTSAMRHQNVSSAALAEMGCIISWNLKFTGLHYSVTEESILHKILSVLFKISLLYWRPINHLGNVWVKHYSCVNLKIITRILSRM